MAKDQCHACEGRGAVPALTCWMCGGAGIVSRLPASMPSALHRMIGGEQCSACHGFGTIGPALSCTACQGSGKVKIKIKIKAKAKAIRLSAVR
jgi:molecular chaperone DnaJ